MINAILDFLLFISLCVCVCIDYKKYCVSKITLFSAFMAGCCLMTSIWCLCNYLGV